MSRTILSVLFTLVSTLILLASGLVGVCGQPDSRIQARQPSSRESADLAEVVGEYWRGYGGREAMRLKLDSDGRFVAAIQIDIGAIGRAEGTFRLDGRILRFNADRRANEDRRHPKPDLHPLRVVTWGERIFLVPSNKLGAFVDSINQDEVFRWGATGGIDAAFRPASDYRKRVFGAPDLPCKWKEKIRQAVIVGVIEEIEGGKTARLNVGSRHGVSLGMRFAALDGAPTSLAEFTVAKVSETYCEARIPVDGIKGGGLELIARVPFQATTCSRPSSVEPPSCPTAFDSARLAGEYQQSDVYSVQYLTLQPDGRFIARVETHGTPFKRVEGTFQFDGTTLKFAADQTDDQTPSEIHLPPMYAVVWGERVYLVFEEEMDTFVTAVNEDWFFRWGSREPEAPTPPFGYEPTDDKKRVFGLPVLPAEWQKKLRQSAIVGAIDEVLSEKEVRLNVGGMHGVTPGMYFDLIGGNGHAISRLRVTAVTEATSEAKVLGYGIDSREDAVLANVPLTLTSNRLGVGELRSTRRVFDRARLVGRYGRGMPNLWVDFDLRASGQFSAYLWTDAGVSGLGGGTFDVDGRTVKLAPRHEEPAILSTYLDRRPLLIVPWGERIFLVAEDKLEAFVEDINEGTVFGGSRVRRTVHWGRQSDFRKRVFGIAELPPDLQKRVRQTVVLGIVDEVLKKDVVRLNVGSVHGVRAGMEFEVRYPWWEGEVKLKVAKVGKRTSRARVVAGRAPTQGSEVIAEVLMTPRTTSQPGREADRGE